MKEHEVNIVSTSFDGFMQQLFRLMQEKYVYVSVTKYPEHKQDKWPIIDQKLVDKYPPLSKSKYQRAYRSKKGLMNAMIVRWDNCCILLCTGGKDDCGIREQEHFQHIKSRPIVFEATRSLRFKVGMRNKSFTASLEAQCFRELLAYYEAEARKGRLTMLQDEFRGLDKTAMSYAGIFAQKVALQKAIIKSAKSAGHYWKRSQFPVALKRKSIQFCARKTPVMITKGNDNSAENHAA